MFAKLCSTKQQCVMNPSKMTFPTGLMRAPRFRYKTHNRFGGGGRGGGGGWGDGNGNGNGGHDMHLPNPPPPPPPITPIFIVAVLVLVACLLASVSEADHFRIMEQTYFNPTHALMVRRSNAVKRRLSPLSE